MRGLMTRYQNFNGNSGVLSYALAADSIRIKFIDGKTYIYSYATAGKENVEEMKRLAKAGRGLATFISKRKPGYIEL
jgi:hypothetical protein